MELNYLKNKRILVTGGAGFLGSHLIDLMKKNNLLNIFIPKKEDYDLVEEENILRLLNEFKPNVVIHLAALVGGIGANRLNPAKFFYENAKMGINMLHHSYMKGVDKAVMIGTICAYPKHTPVPFKEEYLWEGYPEETNAPYGLAKKMLLVQSQAYRNQYGFNSIYLLPVNLYGPRDNFHPEHSHVIPAMIKKFFDAKLDNKDRVTLWGDGSPTREFLYVEDAAEGILLAAEKYNKPDPINLGTGKEISIKDLAELIKKFCGFDGEIYWDTNKPNGQPRRCLHVEKAKGEIGFEAKTPFNVGLKKTIEWYAKERGINI